MKPRAYSYLRFSTPAQLEGDSLRRQTEAARDYADRHSLDLADLTFRDLGVSAFKGKNATEGALGAFIQAVDSGKVEKGSYLLVENLDRLSRDTIRAARDRFEAILDRGINIVTLTDGRTYSAEGYDLTDMLVTLLDMSRAHGESALKSKRGRAAWEQKKQSARETGEVLTRSVPAWLRVRDGKIELDKRKARVVRRIFELAAEGWGTQRIAREFNAESVPVFGRANGWSQSYVSSILRNEAVIGVFQPMKNVHEDGEDKRLPDGDPIPDYFPRVIEDSLFYSVKHTRRGPSGSGGDGLQRNLLSKLVFCAKCGGPMHYVNKGRGHQYLDCDNKRRRLNKCKAPAVPYFATFAYVMLALDDFRPFEPDSEAVQKRVQEVDALTGQIAETREAVESVIDNMERSTSPRLAERLGRLESDLETMEAKREELKAKATVAVDRVRPLDLDLDDDPIAEYIIFEGDRPVPKDKIEKVRAGRAHIAAEIRRVVERVEVEKGQPVKVIPRS